jgi:type 1 glutamine amidotransferase
VWYNDCMTLTNGVGELGRQICGPVFAIGSDAFPVVIGLEGGATAVPVVGGARCGKGKVVALGHSGWLSAACAPVRFLYNAINWSSSRTNAPPRVLLMWCDVKSVLQQQHGGAFASLSVGEENDWVESLATVDVLVLGERVSGITQRQVQQVLAFVRRGGGLVCK